MLNKGYLLYVLIVSQVICQDIRSLYLSQIDDTKYECSSVGCSPSTTVLTLNLQRCQMACLNNQQCRTVTFDHNYNQCEMFMDIPSQYGTLSAHINMTTMIATDERQLSAPMTSTTIATSSTTSTTTTTTTITTTKTTTTTTTTTTS